MMKKILIILVIIFPLKVNAISAHSAIVMDQDSGMILYEENAHDKMLIASISKIMTCIIAIENGNLDDTIKADNDILKVVGSSIYIEIGETLTLKDLLYGMMMRSGNDAAYLIAKSISGSMESFSILMNDYAKKIGMYDSFFINSHGLEDEKGNGNISTAYDMALLTKYAMQNNTFREIFKTLEYTCKSDKKTYYFKNKNKLLKYNYITGGKTGYTKKANRTLVSTSSINGMNLIIVTLNDSNDWNDHIELYNSVKSRYSYKILIKKNKFYIYDDSIFLEDKLYINNDIGLILNNNDSSIKIKYFLADNNRFKDGEKIGEIQVYLGESLIKVEPIFIKKGKYIIINRVKRFWHRFIN